MSTETKAEPTKAEETNLEKAKDPEVVVEDTKGVNANVNGKRAREDDGGEAASAEPAVKKVDAKTGVAA